MDYFIFDSNFFIDLIQVKEKSVLDEISKILEQEGMRGVLTTDILGEVKMGSMQNRMKRLFTVINTPSPSEPLFGKLNGYRGRKLVLNPQNAQYYPRRDGDPDIQLTWLAAKILKGEIFPEDEAERKCTIVTDDEGVEIFTTDYFSLKYEGDPSECSVLKPYWFMKRIMNRALKPELLQRFGKIERYMFNNHIKYKKTHGRIDDIISATFQLREENSRQMAKIHDLLSRAEQPKVNWKPVDQEWVREYLDHPSLISVKAEEEAKKYRAFLPCLDALKRFTATARNWDLQLPVPEEIYQDYYQLQLQIHNFKQAMQDSPSEDVARFFFVSLVIDARVFNIFMDIVQLYLQENNVTRAIETMNLISGHLSSLQTKALVSFHALLAFLWVVQGEKNIAKNLIYGVAADIAGQPRETPELEFYDSVAQLIDFLERDFESFGDMESYLTAHMNKMAGCADEPLDSDLFRNLSGKLHDLALAQASMGSPFAEKLLLFTAMAKKLSCVPEPDFFKAAEKYVQFARASGEDVKFADQLSSTILADHTSSGLPADKKISDFTSVEEFAGGFYTKHFHVSRVNPSADKFHITCWFEPLSSFILLELPHTTTVASELKNPMKIWLESGKIKTSNDKRLMSQYGVRVILKCAEDIQIKAKNRSFLV